MSRELTGGAGKESWSLTTDDGVELYVETMAAAAGADPDSAPVLLVNGITMSTESWNQLGRLLQKERAVVRYDMRGQGASGAPAGPADAKPPSTFQRTITISSSGNAPARLARRSRQK